MRIRKRAGSEGDVMLKVDPDTTRIQSGGKNEGNGGNPSPAWELHKLLRTGRNTVLPPQTLVGKGVKHYKNAD